MVEKLSMLRKMANSYWWISFCIGTKNGDQKLRDAFGKHKIQEINKENLFMRTEESES